jgi:hypothetical protein
MKKLKFTTKTAIAVYAMLAVVLSSCEESTFPETPSKFVVERIEPNKTKGTSIYLVRPIEEKDLNMSKTWFVDSVGRFNAGDTLSFQHYR